MNISDRVKAILCEQLGVDEDEVTPSTSLWDDLGCDSLDLLEIAMACEEEFHIEIPNEAMENMPRVKDLVEFVEAALSSK